MSPVIRVPNGPRYWPSCPATPRLAAARRSAVRTGAPGALVCQELPEARSAVSCISSWRSGPPSAPSTTCGALSSRPTSDWFAGVALGNGR
ncbi:hypothetical protein NG816_25045, partial [Streptomyces sp. A13(2022)]|nr:hypothetical protein [Streptomyces sp. A13(2022)]